MPGHVDKHPSLRISERNGKVLVRCWSGCDQRDVIDELRHRGLWGGPLNGWHYAGGAYASSDKPKDPMKAWRSAAPFVRGSAVDVYLKNRGLDITDDEASSLRFSPAQWHWPSASRWPAMVAKVALADGTDCTSHMTFLEFDGSGKAPLEKERLFAAGGKTTGGGVWFGKADPERPFIVAEGVESLLSALRLEGVTAGCAALSEGGIRTLILPPEARRVRIFCDNDELGQSVEAAREAARRWRAEGRDAKATMAEKVGEDANDVWLRRCR